MNSSKVFNDVVDYLERIIQEGDEIDYDEISKIAINPAASFQRIFIFVSGISISDYVRKRKLTLAGHELKNSGISVLDTAVKYGFQSHSAFTRAFKEHHGITPSEAKLKTTSLNDYPPINFSDMRFVGGKRVMAEVNKIIYKEAEERVMIGLNYKTSYYDIEKLHQDFRKSGAQEKLNTLPTEVRSRNDIGNEAHNIIGLIYNNKMNSADYIIGDFVKPGIKIPEGLSTKKTPKGLTAHIQMEGNNISDILDSAYFLGIEAIEKTGKKIDKENIYIVCKCIQTHFYEPLSRRKKVIIDFIIPVK